MNICNNNAVSYKVFSKNVVLHIGDEVYKKGVDMFNELLLPGTVSFSETFSIYLEGLREFLDEILYRISKFELRL